MNNAELKRSLGKQRQINRSLMAKLRAETMLTTALSELKWHKHEQTEAAIEKVRRALELKSQINGGATITTFYPTGRKSA
jgi:hypothetical protein